jgi:hypothetical protein
MTLQEIYLKHKRGDWPDKGSVHSYIEFYEEVLAPYRRKAKNILEIGLMSGESLRMWSEYFTGTVYGIDCDLKPVNGLADLSGAIAEGYNIVIGDASNEQDIRKFFTGIKFDVVIEDAGHDLQQQIDIFNTIKPYLSDNSIYISEDLQSIENAHALGFEILGEVFDRRHIKGRYDDILVVHRKISFF